MTIGAALFALALAGCGGVGLRSLPSTTLVKCPAILPPQPGCITCSDYVRPEIQTIEDMEAALNEAEIALLECETVNDACVRRDRIITREWTECE